MRWMSVNDLTDFAGMRDCEIRSIPLSKRKARIEITRTLLLRGLFFRPLYLLPLAPAVATPPSRIDGAIAGAIWLLCLARPKVVLHLVFLPRVFEAAGVFAILPPFICAISPSSSFTAASKADIRTS